MKFKYQSTTVDMSFPDFNKQYAIKQKAAAEFAVELEKARKEILDNRTARSKRDFTPEVRRNKIYSNALLSLINR